MNTVAAFLENSAYTKTMPEILCVLLCIKKVRLQASVNYTQIFYLLAYVKARSDGDYSIHCRVSIIHGLHLLAASVPEAPSPKQPKPSAEINRATPKGGGTSAVESFAWFSACNHSSLLPTPVLLKSRV